MEIEKDDLDRIKILKQRIISLSCEFANKCNSQPESNSMAYQIFFETVAFLFSISIITIREMYRDKGYPEEYVRIMTLDLLMAMVLSGMYYQIMRPSEDVTLAEAANSEQWKGNEMFLSNRIEQYEKKQILDPGKDLSGQGATGFAHFIATIYSILQNNPEFNGSPNKISDAAKMITRLGVRSLFLSSLA